MKILHVNKFLRIVGGSETYMFSVASIQEQHGHQVEFFGTEHPENDPRVGAVLGDRLRLAPGIDLADIPSSPRAKLREATSLIWNERARKAFRATVEAFEPDVVHLHNIYHQLSPSILQPLRRRTATIMTLHDYKLACPTYTFLSHGELCQDCVHGGFRSAVRRRCQDNSLAQSSLLALESRIHRTAKSYGAVDRFLCPSRFLADSMREAGVFPERLHHLPNFVLPSNVERSTSAIPTVLFVGRLSHEKGVDVLVDAARLLTTQADVVVVGDGPERVRLAEYAEKTGSPARFVGRKTQPEVRALLGGATALVVPSRWHENQPISILEALSQRVPVISTNLGGLPELVVDGHTGLTVEPEDPAALAVAIDQVVSSGRLRTQMGDNGAAMVGSEHSPELHVTRLNDHYRAALDLP